MAAFSGLETDEIIFIARTLREILVSAIDVEN